MSSNPLNELLETLKEEFLATLPERLAEIESVVLSLPDIDNVENLMRIVHSLKGAAGTHGFHIFTKICHQMEDMMRELINSKQIHSQKAVDVLLDYNDLLDSALDSVRNGGDNFVQIENRLTEISNIVGEKTYKILVVEPSPLYASMILSMFDDSKYQVQLESNGLIALQNLLMQSYDAVITAKEVPTLNGEALVSAIRISENKNKNINAILVTTKSRSMIKHADIFNQIVDRTSIKDGDLLELLQ